MTNSTRRRTLESSCLDAFSLYLDPSARAIQSGSPDCRRISRPITFSFSAEAELSPNFGFGTQTTSLLRLCSEFSIGR
jgi:hypothetical protein